MPYLIGVNVNDGSGVEHRFDPEIDRRLRAGLAIETAISAEERAAIPRVLRVAERRKGGLPAIIGMSIGPYFICQRLRDLLEELEPGRHDFVPIEVRSLETGANEKVYGTYYLLLCVIRLDAVIIEETGFARGFGWDGYEKSGTISMSKYDPCVLDKSVIAAHHLWRLPEKFGSTPSHPDRRGNKYFCSDELWKRMRAEKMDGWAIDKKCIAKHR